MSDNMELSRRKILGGVGAVGAAGAAAGLGTTALFSDEESFTNNSITAGELDLKLDYKATYAGGPGRLSEIDSWYSDDGPGEPFDVEEIEEGRYLIGEVPNLGEGDVWADEVQDTDLCAPELGLINGDEIPVFTLEDVKPGDSGEVTVSLHVCDNDSWMYMNGELTMNDENTVTEPEADSDEENNDETDTPIDGDGELADAIETTLWYDENCNNVFDGQGEDTDSDELCVQLVLDTSGSIGGDIGTVETAANGLADTILDANDSNEVGATTFSDGSNVVNSVADNWEALDGLGSGGGTNMSSGISSAGSYQDLSDDSDYSDFERDLENCTEGHDRIMVVFTDGQPSNSQAALDAADDLDDDIEIYAIGVSNANEEFLNELTTGDEDDDSNTFLIADDTTAEEAIEQVFSQVGQAITGGEQILLEDTLANVMDALQDGVALDGNRSTEEREPFAGAMTHCLGFEWKLPLDVGNEVQTDSLAFDLGFYALQSRNVDDPPENPFGNNEYTDDNGLPSD